LRFTQERLDVLRRPKALIDLKRQAAEHLQPIAVQVVTRPEFAIVHGLPNEFEIAGLPTRLAPGKQGLELDIACVSGRKVPLPQHLVGDPIADLLDRELGASCGLSERHRSWLIAPNVRQYLAGERDSMDYDKHRQQGPSQQPMTTCGIAHYSPKETVERAVTVTTSWEALLCIDRVPPTNQPQ
jgi:hypothetical protein